MTEELYIIVSGKSHKLDLNSPSGITLKYVSNLFNDISKISCSHSYTFKLPKTANNCKVLDMADDIRHNSTVVRKKLKAVFMQNGVSLFRDANLYIESIDNAYQAVFTWDVISGLQALKDNDISLNRLPELGIANYKRHGFVSGYLYNEQYKNNHFSNDSNVLYPFYYAGIEPELPYGSLDIGSYWDYKNHWYCGLPVVPIFKLIECINSYYGVNFKFGKKFSWENWNDNEGNYTPNGSPDIINRGVIPLVNWELSSSHQDSLSSRLRINNTYKTSWHGTRNVLLFKSFTQNSDVFKAEENTETESDGSKLFIGVKFANSYVANSVDLDGVFIYKYETEVNEVVLNVYVYDDLNNVLHEISAIQGVTNDNCTFRFDFRAAYGYNRIRVDAEYMPNTYCIIFFCLSVVSGISSCNAAEVFFYPIASLDAINKTFLSITHNLPDISSMTFIKSIYFMIGAFPVIENDGSIVAICYNKLKENISNGVVYDWSKKAIGNKWEANNIKFNFGGFAQKNYFLMKNDNLGEYKAERDFYERGKGCIQFGNETLEPSKTIFQLPFYGKFLEDLRYYFIKTGETVKMWERDGNEIKAIESLPAVGLIYGRQWSVYKKTNEIDQNGDIVYSKSSYDRYILSMDIWDGFKNMSKNESYAYLQSIVKNPIVITENFLLSELELHNLDYAVPIYLEKYNSYFAIITLERDSKGICKAELIKLPNN